MRRKIKLTPKMVILAEAIMKENPIVCLDLNDLESVVKTLNRFYPPRKQFNRGME